MDFIGNTGNWIIKAVNEDDGILITKAMTPDNTAALPDRLFGSRILGIGYRAMVPAEKWELSEEDIIIADGACFRLRDTPDTAGLRTQALKNRTIENLDEYTNSKLRVLTLPGELKYVGNYGLMNLRALRTLNLSDTVESWGNSSLAGCRMLSEFNIDCRGGGQNPTAYFVREISRELDISIHDGDSTLRLIFPEYTEEIIETPQSVSDIFQYFITGAGYPYHHSFGHGDLNIKEYDRLWPSFTGMAYEMNTAVRLAWWRLRYPVSLLGNARARYLDFIRRHPRETVLWLTRERDAGGLNFFFTLAEADRETLSEAADIARNSGSAETLGLLLEEMHKRFPSAKEKQYVF